MKYSMRSLMRFSIRDIAFVTVIVAILVAWWVDHGRQASEIKELKEEGEKALRKWSGFF